MNKKVLLIICLLSMFLIAPAPSEAVSIAELEQVSPIPQTYSLISDFYPFYLTGVGDITARLQDDIGLGSDPADFSGFVAGNIALIERGFSSFETKVTNAIDAGAVGVLIYDRTPEAWQDVTLYDISEVPAIFITRDLGLSLLGLLDAGSDVEIRMVTYTSYPPLMDEIPEPSAWILFVLGLAGIGLFRRKFTTQ
jgi:hypothetical protein